MYSFRFTRASTAFTEGRSELYGGVLRAMPKHGRCKHQGKLSLHNRKVVINRHVKPEAMKQTRCLFTITAVLLLLASAGCITDQGMDGIIHPPPAATPAPVPHPNAIEIAPAEILGMNKVVVSTGTDALQRVRKSHIGSIENIEDLAIIHYHGEGEGFLTLWTTLYKNETLASDETEKMVIGIRKFGGDWASTLEEIMLDEKTVYRIAPGDLPQYFWVDGVWVFYVTPHNLTPEEVTRIIRAIP